MLCAALSGIGDAVIGTGINGGATFLNPISGSLTGWTRAEVAGFALDRVSHTINQTGRAPVVSPAARALREGVVAGPANRLLIATDGAERPVDDSAPLISRAHEPVLPHLDLLG